MKLVTNTCYSHIIHMQMQPALWSQAITGFKMGKPRFEHEGMAGYIETDVEFQIGSISAFAELWMSWYTESTENRNRMYQTLLYQYYKKK